MPSTRDRRIVWAPRVSREIILRLYQDISEGIHNETLIDEIARAFYLRCADIVRVTEGQFACPECHAELPRPHEAGKGFCCGACGWQMTWKEHWLTYYREQLSVNTQVPQRYLHDLAECRTLQEKVILIDSLIHACHESIRDGIKYYTRPLAVNLIEGNQRQVIAFLENLPYGPGSSPDMDRNAVEWRNRCLNIMSAMEIEWDMVTRLVDSMPKALREEVEVLISQKQRQKGIARLAMFREYAPKLKCLRGTIARQMVRQIEKQTKARARTLGR